MLVSRDGEYMMTGGDKGIVEVRVITLVSQLTEQIFTLGLENF